MGYFLSILLVKIVHLNIDAQERKEKTNIKFFEGFFLLGLILYVLTHYIKQVAFNFKKGIPTE